MLVTADDGLPAEHAEALSEVGGTIATLEPNREAGWPLDAWRRELVHRWAHVMQDQSPATMRRYGLRRHRPWRPRPRRRRT